MVHFEDVTGVAATSDHASKFNLSAPRFQKSCYFLCILESQLYLTSFDVWSLSGFVNPLTYGAFP